MADILNGGIYNVGFKGSSPAEFNGTHPAIVIQTVKEQDMYIAIPLTTYTKEKWEKARIKGFATKLPTTNSIARIDKIQILHKRKISNRWKEFGNYSKITPAEMGELKRKVDRYLSLSTDRTMNDYQKYHKQYVETLNYLNDCKNGVSSPSNYCSLNIVDNSYEITIIKTNVNKLPFIDIEEIVRNVFNIGSTESVNVQNQKTTGSTSQFIQITFTL